MSRQILVTGYAGNINFPSLNFISNKHKRMTVVVSEPYPKNNTQQQLSKEQGEYQPSVDQSTVTQVNKSLYCDKCAK